MVTTAETSYCISAGKWLRKILMPGRIQGLPNFFTVAPIISGTGKATNFQILYAHGFYRIDWNKSRLKFPEK